MSESAAITASVTITVNSVAKVYSAVKALNFDYFKGKVNIVDATGSFYFSIAAITTLTYTIAGTSITVVAS